MTDWRAEQAVLLLADGTRPDVLRSLAAAGELPGLARLFPEEFREVPSERGRGVAVAAFPTTTGPAHLPLLTGRFPGACNIPGIRWFDPGCYGQRPWSLSRFRSYMGLGNYLAARDLSPQVATLFEQIPDHASIAGNVRRGVRFWRDLTRWAKVVHNIRSFFVEEWYGFDAVAGRHLLQAVQRGITFVFASFYAADSNGHKFGPDHPRTLEAYRRIDRIAGALADQLTRERRTDQVFVALVSDHGLSATHTHLDLQALVERIAAPCLAHPTVWHGWWGARSAVMVSGNAMAHVAIRGPGGWTEPGWLDRPHPLLAQLRDALLAEPAVDQIAGRTSDGGVLVLSRRGQARLRLVEPERTAASLAPPGQRLEYLPDRGDPFGYPPDLAGCHTRQELLEQTWTSEYPDAPVQLLQLFDSPRCGHLVVTAAPGYDLRARYEKPAHQGSHGSLHRVHMLTPCLFSHPLPGSARLKRTADLHPTLLSILGQARPAGLDGMDLGEA